MLLIKVVCGVSEERNRLLSAVSPFPLVKERGGGVPNCSKRRLRTVYFYFLGGGHFKYLYLCGGTPKIIKILVVVTQIIDGVLTPPGIFFLEKPLVEKHHIPLLLTTLF
jgi:hypothetical protein